MPKTKKSPAKPVKKAPAKKVSAPKTPAKKAVVAKVPAPKAPVKKKPAPKAPAPKHSTKPAPAKKPAPQPHKAAAHSHKPAPAAKEHSHRKPAPAHHAKPAPAKHHPPIKANVPSKKPTPTPTKKSAPAAKATSAKPASAPKPVAKAPAKPLPAAKAPAKPAHVPAAKPGPAKPVSAAARAAVGKVANKAENLRARILERRSAKPIAFTLDEVREIAKVNTNRGEEANGNSAKSLAAVQRTKAEELEAKLKKAAQPHFVQAASLADILGFNPAKQAAPTVLAIDEVEPKFQRYYKLLIELRNHVAEGLDTHTEQTLKRSAKDDAGDLSSYAQHMADAGTDTFDRDFALSLVSNEQEALAEIEAAIQRIKTGTYGVCELTGRPINKERLLAVPFARFSVESQAEVERTKRRSASRAGLFAESEDGTKYDDDGGSDE